MKKILLILLVALGNTIWAQDIKPLTYSAKVEKTNYGSTDVVISFKIDKGWHIFTHNPGGDDMIIPTNIVAEITNADGTHDVIEITDRMANQKPKTTTMQGIGTINYFEGDLEFRATLYKPNPKKVSVKLNFQTCNDKMCLPPTETSLNIDLKK
jgi:DsbC/DsbD-like thiol-disulfide interchange protein